MRIRYLCAISAFAILTACGGGSGGNAAAPGPGAQSPGPTPLPPPTPTPPGPTPAPTPTPGGTTGQSTDMIPVGTCVNMGNHLEAPNEGDWGRPIELADFDRIAAAGFDTIRLPVRWSNHASESAPYTIDAAFMTRVETLVDAALGAGLNVILDDHHYEELHRNPAGHAERLAGLWTQIAATFADRPLDSLWFEIANEPNDRLTHANLLETLAPALAAIRQSNPTRAVIIGGENWSGIGSLATLPLPDDPHVIPTFHYYDPFEFTHQGATWLDNPPPLGRVYGSDADRAALTADVQKVRDYIARTGKTPFIGEFGAHDTVPLEGRVPYYRAVREAFEGEVSGYCAWGYTATFPLYDDARGVWNEGMLEAMGLGG